ncbi:MAG TPA: hypothetical protein VFE36_11695 [Candidatus Baltobacteraceae bacterium]|nr:hypothetical protein [Candidatus Baltobacteraceae bacterium]
MLVSSYAADLAQTLAGVFRLSPDAFVTAATLTHEAMILGLTIVLLAGFSEAVAASIVLFANRVQPARFIFTWAIDSLLFVFGYFFLVGSTWVVCRILHAPQVPFRELAAIFAVSYAPLLFSFLGALPLLGPGLLNLLRAWHFLALIVGLAAVIHVTFVAAACYVALGWIGVILAQQSFGKPIAELGTRVLDAVAGVRLVDDEDLVIGRASSGSSLRKGARGDAPAVSGPIPLHPAVWKAAIGLVGVGILTIVVALLLDPVRGALFGWEVHLPRVARIPIDLFWLGILAIIVAGFMAPVETLGWWAGWYGDRIDATVDVQKSDDKAPPHDCTRYIVYLDGVAQSSSRYTPDIETFLDALAPELPEGTRLIRGVMAYSVMNRPLEQDPLFSRLWSFIDKLRFGKSGGFQVGLLGMIVNLRNMLIVAVSADPRYGPMYNFGIAHVVVKSLIANGYKPRSGVPVTLIGYSGGGQMACGSARFIKQAIDAPIDVVSLGGVINGDDPILELEHLYHLVGDRDKVERVGPYLFASRWKIAVLSQWNRARRLGRLTEISLGPVGHQVPGGMLDPDLRLVDGRTALRQTLDYIEHALDGTVDVSEPWLQKKESAYERYRSVPWNRADYYPALKTCAEFSPVADWAGRLILPDRKARFGGALLELRCTPADRRELLGATVRLQWNESSPRVREMLRAVRRDVNFGAEAYYTSTYGGIVHPVRLNRWRLVDPLESLAGAHPHDDVFVKLVGTVHAARDGEETVLRVEREPVQVTGCFFGLVRFLEPQEGDAVAVAHYDSATHRCNGKRTLVRVPAPVDRALGSYPGDDWYVYGLPDVNGTFVVQAMAPREVLRAHEDGVAWIAGDRALLVQIAGGAFGHYAYGTAEVVRDATTGDLRFVKTYYHLHAHNTEGLVSGASDWSHAMGDRQFGWAGERTASELVVKDERLVRTFGSVALQLGAMAARYRTGDGTGGTYAGIAHNSTQDSNRAFVKAVPQLRRKLEPFGALYSAWTQNEFSLGSTFEDAPMRNLAVALSNWPCIVPSLARDAIVRALAHDGADVTSTKCDSASYRLGPPERTERYRLD